MIDFTKEGRVGDRVRNFNGEIAIGDYTIRWLDIDYLEVAHKGLKQTVTVCGGDLETVLSVLFIGTKIKEELELK